MPNNLLTSDGGIELPREVCLHIAQEVIDNDCQDANASLKGGCTDNQPHILTYASLVLLYIAQILRKVSLQNQFQTMTTDSSTPIGTNYTFFQRGMRL